MVGFIAVLVIGLNGRDVDWKFRLHRVTYLKIFDLDGKQNGLWDFETLERISLFLTARQGHGDH